jgi:hypothetical protein
MAVQPIPDEHHVVRHCKKRETIREKGAVTGVYPQAFLLRPAKPPIRLEPETYLSCNYYEHFIGAAAAMMKSCCEALAFQPKPLDTMIRLNVGRIKSCFKKYSVGVRVTHEPKRNNPSYAAIRPGKIDDPIAGVLATVAVVELVGVGEILRT